MNLWALSFHIKTIGNQKLCELQMPNNLNRLRNYIQTCDKIHGFYILNTCNRLELLLNTSSDFDFNNFLKNFQLNQYEHKKLLSQHEIIQHYLSVILSMDSIVFGENQIQGQFIKTYEAALHNQELDKHLSKLLQLIINSAKNIRKSTKLSGIHNSVATVAARELLNCLKNKNAPILFIGSGQTNQLFARFITKRSYKNIHWCNRTKENSLKVIKETGGTLVEWAQLSTNTLGEYTAIVTATSCPDYLVTEEIATATQCKLLIDLSIPNNCNPNCQKIVDKFISVESLNKLLKYEEVKFIETKKTLEKKIFTDTIRILKDFNVISHDSLISKEIENTQRLFQEHLDLNLPKSLNSLSPQQIDDLQIWSKTLVKKITHDHLKTLKKVVSHNSKQENQI